MAAFQFSGGEVGTLPEPTVEVLRENSAAWRAMAQVHFADGERLADEGDIDGAIEQFALGVRTFNSARLQLIEARELQQRVQTS
jgi:hypothetical protein